MASSVVVQSTCDACFHYGIKGVPAPNNHKISIDGGKEKNVDLCDRCEVRDFGPILAIYVDLAQEVPAPRQRLEPKKRVHELTSIPTLPEDKDSAEKPRLRVICPLDHPSHGGGPYEVTYTTRSSHAQVVHGLDVTGIKWEDPYRIMTAYCDSHQQCIDNKVGFTTEQGLKAHIKSSAQQLISH